MVSIQIPDDELELTGSLGLDFVNTALLVRGRPVDLLETPDDFLAWLQRVGGADLAGLAPADPPGRRTLTVEARALREALVALFRSVAAGSAPPSWARHVVNSALGAGAGSWELTSEGGRPAARQLFQARDARGVLTPITLSAVEVARDADRARLRECDAPDCRRWFVDTSKGGRRRWCSMDGCGNRMKAARYRRRHADG